MKSRRQHLAIIVVFLVFADIFGQNLSLELDEGIFLAGSEYVARGSNPYLDFFALTGPWTFWGYGLLFQVLGASLPTAHVFLALILSCTALAAFSIANRLVPTWLAIGYALIFLSFLFSSPYHLYVTHRWDNNSLAIASIAVACAGEQSVKTTYPFVAGILIGFAILATPSFAVVFAAIALWLLVTVEVNRVKACFLFCAGAATSHFRRHGIPGFRRWEKKSIPTCAGL